MPATFLLHSAFICTKPAKFCSHRRPSAELPRLVGTARHPATAQLGWEDTIQFFTTACCQLCRRAPQLPTHRRLLHPRPHNPGLTIRPTTPPAPPYYPPPDRASQPRHGLGQCRPGGLCVAHAAAAPSPAAEPEWQDSIFLAESGLHQRFYILCGSLDIARPLFFFEVN